MTIIYLPSGGILDLGSSTAYSPDGKLIQGYVAPTSSGTSVRALILVGNEIRQITDAQKSTGLKPLVRMNSGEIRQRSGTEGTPVVFVNNQFRTLAPTETLLI